MTAPNLDFSRYLKSIQAHYERWWELYTLTDAMGRERQEQKQQALAFDFSPVVQTVQRQEQAERQAEEKIERLPVLEGIRKYALDPDVRQVLLVGRPGSGKSTALARLMLEESLTPGPSPTGRGEETDRIPVLVELRYWQSTSSIRELVCGAFRAHGLRLSAAGLDDLLSQNRLLLLFDGVNELPSEQARSQLTAFRREHSQLSMIFTTRDLSLGGDLGIEKKLEMQPLTETQMQGFVRAYLPESKAEAMLRQLRERLRELGQTPLLLWMLCCLFQQTEQIPENLGLVFRAFTQGYERNLKQDVPIESDRDWWQMVLQELAWVMMQGEKPTELRVAISRDEARSKIAAFLQGKVSCADDFAMRCLRDLQRHHLIQAGTGDELEFRHQLIQEYYAALALLERLEQLSDAELKCDYLNYLKWTEPLALMLPLIDSETLVKRVVKLSLEVDWKLGARLAGEAIPDDLQQQTVELVKALEVPWWLKVELLEETRSRSAIHALGQFIHGSYYYWWGQKSAAEALDKIDHLYEEAIPFLMHQARRRSAAEALGKIGHPDAVLALSQALQDSDDQMRRSAAEALGKIGHPNAVLALSQALQDSDNQVRRGAVEALGKIGHPDAFPALIQALQNSNNWVRLRAASILSEIGHPDVAVPYLIRALQDSDDEVRRRAATALVKIGSDAVLALIQALQDSDDQVRRAAISVLREIGHPDAVPAVIRALQDSDDEVRRRAATALHNIGQSDAVPYLFHALQDSDDEVRWHAVVALVNIRHPDAVPYLIKALQNSDFSVRLIAAAALGKIGHPDAFPALIQALQNPNDWVRLRAASILSEIGHPDVAVPYLIKALQNSDFSVRLIAAAALGKIGHPDAFPALIQALQNSNNQVRRRAASILSEIGHPDVAVPYLIKMLQDSDDWMGRSAAEALLVKIGSAVVPALIQALQNSNDKVRWSAAEALVKIGSAAVPYLIRALQDSDDWVRRRAAEALGKIGHPDAVPALIQALQNSKDEVRSWVVQALTNIRHPAAVLYLSQALQNSNNQVRLIAVLILSEIDHPDVSVPHLILALQDSDDWVRLRAAEALSKIGYPDAVPHLIQALQNSQDWVRLRAAEALGNFKKDRAAHALPTLRQRISRKDAFRALTAIQANCKFYNYEVYQQAQARRKQARQQANQATQPNLTIGSVGVLNTGSVTVKGDQVGIQQNSQGSGVVGDDQ
ncbi:MAG: tetratricopeptide repeat protein [Elainella sp.]